MPFPFISTVKTTTTATPASASATTPKAVADTFGRNIPVLVHELEYYDLPNGWTKRANPPGVADEFLAWAQNGGYDGENEDED